MNEWSFGDKLN